MSARITSSVSSMAMPGHAQLQGVQRGLVAVEHQQLLRIEAHQLAAQLRPDRPAGTRDQHPLAPQVVRARLDVGVHRVATQQVRDVDVAQVPEAHPALEDALEARKDLHLHPEGQCGLRDVAEQLGARRGDGDDQDLGSGPLDRSLQGGPVAEHGDALDAQVALRRIVVEQADRQVRGVGVGQHVRHQLGAC